jgi:MFS family permease
VRSALRREVRSLPRTFWLLFVGTIINKAGGFIIPLLALYLTGPRHQSELAAGLVLTCWGAGTVAAGFVGGLLADRVGRRFTMLLSLFAGAPPMVTLGLVHTLVPLAVAAAAMGFVSELYRPAVAAMVADVVPPADRARAYAHLYWAVNLGFAIAPTAAGLVANVSYLAAFLVDAATLVGYGVVVYLFVPEATHATTHASAASASPAQRRAGMGPVFRDATFMWFALITFLGSLAMWQNGLALPLDMRAKGHSPASCGALISVNGALIVLFQPSLIRFVTRFRRTPVFVASMLFFGLGFFLQGVVASSLGYVVAITTWTLGEISNVPVSQSTVADLSPADMRGRYQGVYSMAWGAASLAGPLVGGAALSRFGSFALWSACGGLCALAALGHALLGPARERAVGARRQT